MWIFLRKEIAHPFCLRVVMSALHFLPNVEAWQPDPGALP
jgi:hypothetical protein